MSDTTAAFVVIPFLIIFTLALECTRIGCVWVYRSFRPAAPDEEAGSGPEDLKQPFF